MLFYIDFLKLSKELSKFLRWSLLIFIIKGFWTIAFVFIVISTTFWPICPPAFFRSLSNLRTSFIKSMGVACSDSVSHNGVQVLSIPVLLLACSKDWTCNLQMIASLEALGTNAYNHYTVCPEWIFGTWLGLLLLYMIFYQCSYSDFFFFK